MTDTPRVSDIVSRLQQHDNEEVLYLMAGAMNLYSESLRRRAGKILWDASHVRTMLSITLRLLTPEDLPAPPPPDARRPRAPTEDESRQIMEGVRRAITSESDSAPAPQETPSG